MENQDSEHRAILVKSEKRDRLSDLTQLHSLTVQLLSAADLLGIHPYNGPPQGDLFQIVDDLADRAQRMGLSGLKGLGAQLRDINKLREKMATPGLKPKVSVNENGVIVVDDGNLVVSGDSTTVDTDQDPKPKKVERRFPLPVDYDPEIHDSAAIARSLD